MATADIETTYVPLRSPSVESVELDGQAVLYLESSNTMHVLSPTATLVWACLDGTGTVAEIAQDISAVFEADTSTVRQDVLEGVRALAADGLLAGYEHLQPERAPASNPKPTLSEEDSKRDGTRVLDAPPDT